MALSAAAAAQLPPPSALTRPVNDFANVIDETSERELERRIRSLQQTTGDVVIVATVATFRPYADIKEYAVKMFENAGKGIGERAKDNGLLIVVAVEDRKVAIEVGYGLEPYITDGFSGQTIRESILPAFRKGQYGQGLLAGTTQIINRIADERAVTLQDVPRETPAPGRQPVGFPTSMVFPIIIFIIILIISRKSGRRRRRHWGGSPWSGWNSGVGPFGGGYGGFGGGFGGFGGGKGGFGRGGFGGFGGGRSGGGGASGGW